MRGLIAATNWRWPLATFIDWRCPLIVCSPHPDDPARVVFVPLACNHQGLVWAPLQHGGAPCAFEDASAATAALFVQVLAQWDDVHNLGRVLRALCEHPAFNFSEDGIDAHMVRHQARALSARALQLDDTIRNLLAEPGVAQVMDEIPEGVELAMDSADLVVLKELPSAWTRWLKPD